MRASISSFLSGLLFALGLGVGGMTNPANITAFLDITGDWDFRLALVMAGAIGVHALLRPLILKRGRPFFAQVFPRFSVTGLDKKLLAGAALFGVGWGLGGFCPGPALTSLSTGAVQMLVFVPAMFAGMYLVQVLQSRRAPAPASPAQAGAGTPVLASGSKP
ncbi:MAG TPA: DUF6691 family protein [Myxococcaceae bacterium]|nr:DUF6691 family protein [Myxococcaceae bacterium]